jgi:DNA (cytosine-5)-methyltransferase 1
LAIPIIDIFAGPGGLGEGFCSLLNEQGERVFDIVLSIEKDYFAHRTLTLRSFFRQFLPGQAPDDYYEFIKGHITLDDLYERWPKEAEIAKSEAWHATLGIGEGAVTNEEVDKRIKSVLGKEKNWLMIGGPPCQAYSIVGRSRRQETVLDGVTDERVVLYKQYLRILALHNPAIFVMENVKGILSAETKESPVFSKILEDLANPVKAYIADYGKNGRTMICPGYKVYSLAVAADKFDEDGHPIFNQKDFVIHAEKFGIPQTRHRVILLGIRNDIDTLPDILEKTGEIAISKVLSNLPRLRSGLSKSKDSDAAWKQAVAKIGEKGLLADIDEEIQEKIQKQLEKVTAPQSKTGGDYLPCEGITIGYEEEWYLDDRIMGVCNHHSRGHMESDLHRYFFVSCFAKVKNISPKLQDFPYVLLPNHENLNEGLEDKKFADRFRVQLWNKPAKTITSHISKDGHYYIHPDPTQCRSLTVREAARIQTFPDNYYFCGPRTAQFIQVGNAVPPLLANKIAAIVSRIFDFTTPNQNDILLLVQGANEKA